MISPATFDEFTTPCYREVIPIMKERGVGDILLDTNRDFTALVPDFDEAGPQGVFPVDVNGAVDIVECTEGAPEPEVLGRVQQIFDCRRPAAIDAEFRRLEPAIRQGECIISTDHQPTPHTLLDHYLYFTRQLHDVMKKWRGVVDSSVDRSLDRV